MLKIYNRVIKLAGKNPIGAIAHFYKGLLYLTVPWAKRYQNALNEMEAYLDLAPKGIFAKEAAFRRMYIYIKLGEKDTAVALFDKYDFKKKYPESGFTLKLLELFKNKTKDGNL